MKKMIYVGSVLLMLLVCFESCGKDKNPTPGSGSTGTTGTTTTGGNGGY